MTKRWIWRRPLVLTLGGFSAAILLMWGVYASFGADGGTRPPLRGEMREFVLKPAPAAMPEIHFVDNDERDHTLEDFRGRLVLLNFWATWCGPCVEEMPSLERLQATLKGQPFLVLPVSQDRAGLPLVRRFYQDHDLTGLGMYADKTSSGSHALGLRGLPTSLLLDAQGRELGRFEGAADWSSPDALALIRHYLPKPAEPSPTTATQLETARPPKG